MRLQVPGIRYRQGNREMVTTAMDPFGLVKTVAAPDEWNPLGTQPHGNRPQDKRHREGIAEYLEHEENFVLNSVVLYVSPRDASFEVAPDQQTDAAVVAGTLSLEYGAEFDVGDGQHRVGAYSDVMHRHFEEGDPVYERLRRAGQPVIVVIDDEPLHRAQDFTDLQRNVKAPSGSIGMSMDRRQAINRFMVELIRDAGVPIFGGGDRVEFLKDSPGKLSAKLFSYKTARYVSGTTLLGVSQRNVAGWEKAANTAVETDRPRAMANMVDLWTGIGSLPGFADVVADEMTAAGLREKSLLTTAGVLYAVAYAVWLANSEDGIGFGSAARALNCVNFDRPTRKATESKPLTSDDTFFAGTLIDPMTGKLGSGRPAWESAGAQLRSVIVDKARAA